MLGENEKCVPVENHVTQAQGYYPNSQISENWVMFHVGLSELTEGVSQKKKITIEKHGLINIYAAVFSPLQMSAITSF